MTDAADAEPPFYHGTRADLRVGDLLGPGWTFNYGQRRRMSWIYFAATLDAAIWGSELAQGAAASGPTSSSLQAHSSTIPT